MTWSGLAKLVLGFFLAIALIGSGGYLAAQYVIAEFTKPPAKPIFPNDKPASKPKSVVTTSQPKPSPSPTPPQPSPSVSPSPSPSVSPSPTPTPSATPSPQPSPTAETQARITISEGLNLRDQPSRDGERVGGVDYNEEVVVLEESPDKEWQRVRVPSTGQEGWIRAGYTESAN